MNKKIVMSVLIIAMVFVSAIAGTKFYYDNMINDKKAETESMKSQISNLDRQISDLKSQVANLSGQVTNLTSAYLVTALGVNEVPYDFLIDPPPFSHLFVEGSVTNVGEGTAYNAGLHVVAFDAKGKVEVNMTVPLATIASFGTNVETVDYALKHYEGTNSLKLGNLLTTQTANVRIQIFHEGNVTDWDVTPVWTNSP